MQSTKLRTAVALTLLAAPAFGLARGIAINPPRGGSGAGAELRAVNIHGTPDRPVTSTGDSDKALDGRKWNLDGQTIEGFNITVNRSGIIIERGQSNVVVRNGVFRLRAPTVSPNLPVGYSVVDGHNIKFINDAAYDFRMDAAEGRYVNGDCFSTEHVDTILYQNTIASGCSDGGYDTKATNVRFENASAEKVDICYRIWGQATASAISCKDWAHWQNGAAVQVVASPGGGLVADKLVLSAPEGKPGKGVVVFDIRKPGAVLTIGHCEGLHLANDGLNQLVSYRDGATPENTKITLGPGCALEPGSGPAPRVAAAKAPPAEDRVAAIEEKPAAASAPPVGNGSLPATVISKKLLPNNNGGDITIYSPNTARLLGVPVHTKLIDKPRQVDSGYEYTVKQ